MSNAALLDYALIAELARTASKAPGVSLTPADLLNGIHNQCVVLDVRLTVCHISGRISRTTSGTPLKVDVTWSSGGGNVTDFVDALSAINNVLRGLLPVFALLVDAFGALPAAAVQAANKAATAPHKAATPAEAADARAQTWLRALAEVLAA